VNDAGPPPVEGDVNVSPARAEWRASLSDAARTALDADERYFLRQSLSTPCRAPIVRAEGAVLTGVDGRRIFDFHGNSVHQVATATRRWSKQSAAKWKCFPLARVVSPMPPRRRPRGSW
jgi:hypothetical protein